ncbi:tetratricopeptide repeat-containing sulfotransferase family protein [Blastopirellula marina]|uniref:Sulfotransferase family protein n=1 Tax=Blastopirellula marina TaxID=124 RepID=A0A2S8GQF4_9BACT|nr:tetratricopeptide repeat-containing sulfotransferase family protein [Blastopirellula marina]PQO46655.1 sulfotransferase family protein [Blastopirellula marina]
MAKLIESALVLHQSGDLVGAERIYRDVLSASPDDLDALNLLGLNLHAQGRGREALPLLNRAVRLAPKTGILFNSLGVIQLGLGDVAAAIHSFRESLEHDPRCREAEDNLRRARERLVVSSCDSSSGQLLAGEADLLRHAEQQRDQAQFAAAIATYRAILEQNPFQGMALLGLAGCCESIGDVDPLVECCRRAIRRDESFAPAHLMLGVVFSSRLLPEKRAHLELDERNQLGELALRHLEIAATLDPRAETFDAWGAALVNVGRHVDALEKLRKALEFNPEFAKSHESVGRALLELGNTRDAMAAFQKAVELNPAASLAQYELARSGKSGEPEQVAPKLQKLCAAGNMSLRDRVNLEFALAHRFEQLGDFDSAFQHFIIGNQLKAESPSFGRRSRNSEALLATRFHVDRFEKVFSGDYFASFGNGRKEIDETPLFIVGMPRSGTTLVEQILSSHGEVCGAGELSDIADLASALPRKLGGQLAYPEAAEALPDVLAAEMAESYRKQLRARSQTAKRITDKMPTNFRHLGLIARMFPQARVIHVKRDPLDVCVSCFRQNLEWPFCDLEAVGIYYLGYRQLMRHWRQTAPLRIHDVEYERLVTDPGTEIRKLISFCGLAWDEDCLQFDKASRAVQTPSKWQVRQPVFHSSLGAWRRYDRYLEPLKAILKSAEASLE